MPRIPVTNSLQRLDYYIDKGPVLGDVFTDGITLVCRNSGVSSGLRVKIYSNAGMTSQVTTGLTATSGRSGQGSVTVTDGTITVDVDSTSDYSYKLLINGLTSNTQYWGKVWMTGSSDQTVESLTFDTFTFTTRPSNDSATPNFNFLLIGDYDRNLSLMPLLHLEKERASMVLITGDWWYNDGVPTTLAQYRTEYKSNYGGVNIKRIVAKSSLIHTAGDHDWGVNDYDGSQFANDISGSPSAQFTAARQAMLEYMPIYEQQGANKWYREFYYGKYFHFIVLDQQSYKSTNASTDNSSKSMLGATQKQWFIDTVNGSTASFTIVLSPNPLYNDTTLSDTDGYSAFTTERASIFSSISSLKRVLWVTGDRHINQLHTVDSNNWWHIVGGAVNRGHASWQEAVSAPSGITRDGSAFDTGTAAASTDMSYVRFVWNSTAKSLTFDYLTMATATAALTSVKQKVLTMPTITNINTTNSIAWANTNRVITGTGFKSSQGTGKVYIGTSAALGTGTVVEQSVDTWADTSIQIDPTQGGLSSSGTFYLFVVNSDNITSIAQQISVV